MEYDKVYFLAYVFCVASEMVSRGINFNGKYYDEIVRFCSIEQEDRSADEIIYPEHNSRYLHQCYFNLQEKYDRGIISKKEWLPISEVI